MPSLSAASISLRSSSLQVEMEWWCKWLCASIALRSEEGAPRSSSAAAEAATAPRNERRENGPWFMFRQRSKHVFQAELNHAATAAAQDLAGVGIGQTAV